MLHFVYLSAVDGPLVVTTLGPVDKVSMNIHEQVFVWTCIFYSLGIYIYLGKVLKCFVRNCQIVF
jgi:hypothetical protein